MHGREIESHIPEIARWGLLNCSLVVLRSAGRAAPAEAEPSIEATLGAMKRAEDMVEVVRCQLGSGDEFVTLSDGVGADGDGGGGRLSSFSRRLSFELGTG